MAEKYDFLDSNVDSSDGESLEQLIGLKDRRPKWRKAIPHRYHDESLHEVMEEAALEERFRELNIHKIEAFHNTWESAILESSLLGDGLIQHLA